MNPLDFFFRRSRQRRSLNELSHLDDRLLRDIGLTRSDVLGLRSGKSPRSRDLE
jgi:uncharacterized protein YjiS (DUF1127 family)